MRAGDGRSALSGCAPACTGAGGATTPYGAWPSASGRARNKIHSAAGMMMPPVIVVTPVAIVADTARAVMGPDHPAAAVRIIIGIIVIRVIGRAVEEAPVNVMVREPIAAMANPAVAIAAAMEDRTGAKPAAMEHGAATMEAATVKHRTTAAVKHRAAAVEAATTVEASAAAIEASAAMSAMSTVADFGRQAVGGKFRRGGSARVDQRKRLSALRHGRQCQHRGRRKAETTDNAAPGI